MHGDLRRRGVSRGGLEMEDWKEKIPMSLKIRPNYRSSCKKLPVQAQGKVCLELWTLYFFAWSSSCSIFLKLLRTLVRWAGFLYSLLNGRSYETQNNVRIVDVELIKLTGSKGVSKWWNS
jgi:hypothetical protein